MNNFKRLQEEELGRVPDLSDTQRSVRNRVEGMRTIGQVVELYLTKILDVFVVMSGGNIDQKKSSGPKNNFGYPTAPEKDAPSGGPSAG